MPEGRPQGAVYCQGMHSKGVSTSGVVQGKGVSTFGDNIATLLPEPLRNSTVTVDVGASVVLLPHAVAGVVQLDVGPAKVELFAPARDVEIADGVLATAVDIGPGLRIGADLYLDGSHTTSW